MHPVQAMMMMMMMMQAPCWKVLVFRPLLRNILCTQLTPATAVNN